MVGTKTRRNYRTKVVKFLQLTIWQKGKVGKWGKQEPRIREDWKTLTYRPKRLVSFLAFHIILVNLPVSFSHLGYIPTRTALRPSDRERAWRAVGTLHVVGLTVVSGSEEIGNFQDGRR